MNGLMSSLEKVLLPMSAKVSRNKPLRSISGGFTALFPITILGAIFTLLSSLQIAPYQAFITATKLKEIFNFVPSVTTNMISVYAVYLIAKSMASNLDLDDMSSTIVGIIGLFVFLLLIPQGVKGMSSTKEVVIIPAALALTYLGTPGLFSAMILGIVVPIIYNLFVKNGIVLKMPKEVPPSIAKSFTSLVPSFAIALIFATVRFLFAMTKFGSFNQFVYDMLKMPLSALTASPLTFIVLILVCSVMWFFGIHGGMIVMPFLTMLYTASGLENLSAFQAGVALPHVITTSSWLVFASLGGAGGTAGFAVLLFLRSKSNRYKALGKIAAPASVCGINEPLTFGTPMVLNPLMLVPMIITPITTFLISYVLTILNIIPRLNGAPIPLGTPIVLSGLITGGWKVAVLQVLLIALQALIYFPFFKILDKQSLIEEGKA